MEIHSPTPMKLGGPLNRESSFFTILLKPERILEIKTALKSILLGVASTIKAHGNAWDLRIQSFKQKNKWLQAPSARLDGS